MVRRKKQEVVEIDADVWETQFTFLVKQLYGYLADGMPHTYDEICARFGWTLGTARNNIQTLRLKGIVVKTDRKGGTGKPARISVEPVKIIGGATIPDSHFKQVYVTNKDKGTFKIGIIADTHFSSTGECVAELHDFYNTCRDDGVTHIFHGGDMLDGLRVYRGQENELLHHTYAAQKDHFKKKYPRRQGIKTFMINGNHDDSFMNSAGVNPGRDLANESGGRMEYLGDCYARVEVAPDIRLDMVHPMGANAYAMSYKIQKYIESIQSGNKPHILVMGHYHYRNYVDYRNIHGFQPGCFKRQGKFDYRKGYNPSLGGIILEVKYVRGSIVWVNTKWVKYY